MLSEISGVAGADAFGAEAYGPASPRHWALDDIVWNADALAAAAAPPGSAGGALRPAPLAAAVSEPKAAGTSKRRAQRAATCTALGCSEALYSLGPYYMRNRLCPTHLRAEQLLLTQEGPVLRFCQVCSRTNPLLHRHRFVLTPFRRHPGAQKCNRCHDVGAFEGVKRTCKAQLNMYSARRKARQAASRAVSSSSSGGGGDNSPLLPLEAAPAAGPPLWNEEEGAEALADEADDLLVALLRAPPPARPAPLDTPATTASAADSFFWPPLAAVTAELKVGGVDVGAVPLSLPAELRSAAALALFASPPLGMHAAVEPGCMLLTFQAFVERLPGGSAPDVDAEVALASLLSAPDGVGAYFRARESVSVAVGGRVATARFGAYVAAATCETALPRVPRLAMLAALVETQTALAAATAMQLPAAAALRCRVHGRLLMVLHGEAGPHLAACPEEGAALLELAPTPDAAAFAPRGLPRPLLLTSDAEVVAELNAWASAAHVSPAAWDAAEAAVALLGAAKRGNAPADILAAACAAALALRWRRAAEAPLAALEARGLDTLRDGAGPACAALLLAAVRSADVACVRRVLAAGGPACLLGAAGAAVLVAGEAHTPLHAAAMLSRAADVRATVMELTRCDAGAAAGSSAGADAAIAWLYTTSADGFTPAQLGARHCDTALDALDAQLRADVAAALPMACAAAATTQERYAAAHAPHAAELACGLLAAAADEVGTQRRAALAGALLRRAGHVAAHSAETAAAADAAAVARPAARLCAALRRMLPPQHDEAEAQWRFQQFRGSIELVCAYHICYHIGQALRALALLIPPKAGHPLLIDDGLAAPGVRALRPEHWHEYAAMRSDGSPVITMTLWQQIPATVVMMLALLMPRARTALASHLQPFLAAQYVVHALLCTITMTSAVLATCASDTVVVFPYRLAVTIALFTIFLELTWPLRPRWVFPMLAVRATLPVASVLMPVSRLGRLWPSTGAAGARLQFAVGCIAAVHAVWRERRLRVAYARHVAAAAKRKQA